MNKNDAIMIWQNEGKGGDLLSHVETAVSHFVNKYKQLPSLVEAREGVPDECKFKGVPVKVGTTVPSGHLFVYF